MTFNPPPYHPSPPDLSPPCSAFRPPRDCWEPIRRSHYSWSLMQSNQPSSNQLLVGSINKFWARAADIKQISKVVANALKKSSIERIVFKRSNGLKRDGSDWRIRLLTGHVNRCRRHVFQPALTGSASSLPTVSPKRHHVTATAYQLTIFHSFSRF